MSYFFILFIIFTLNPKKARGKTLSICASHLLSVSVFYGSLLFMYLWPNSTNEEDKDIPLDICLYSNYSLIKYFHLQSGKYGSNKCHENIMKKMSYYS